MKAANTMRNSDAGLKRTAARASVASAPVAPRTRPASLGHRFAVGPIPDETRVEIDKLATRGASVDLLATQFGRSRASILRTVHAMRVKRLMDAKLDGMYHESFDDSSRAAEILGPPPAPPDGRAPRKVRAPEGLPPYLTDLYDVTLLTREQEAHLFRKMNFLKHRAAALRDAIDPAKARQSELDKVERLMAEALAVKNQVIKANLRLVVSIAKKHVNSGSDFFELISEGNMALIRAVEKFDFSRGNKFSTYASWAIMNRFARAIPEENHRRDRFVTGHEAMFESAADTRSDEHEIEFAARRVRETVNVMLGKLDARERRVLESRYGLGGASEQTLEQLGRELGITKERVRQIESRAQEKLRKIADAEALDLAS